MTDHTAYADLEIRILAQQNAKGYPVEMTLNHEQEYHAGYLDPAEVDDWVPGISSEEDGRRLFSLLAANEAFSKAWAEIHGHQSQRRIRLRIDEKTPKLHRIPWECLQDGDKALAASAATPFSRYLAGKWQPGNPILIRPIKILVAIADPDNLSEYNLQPIARDQEWTLLEEATAGLKEVDLDLLQGPCTLATIEEKLQQGYHILHFVGHGKFSGTREEMVLYLADESNQVNLVNGEDLAAMLTRQLADVDAQRNDKLRLVFLASCQSASSSPADAFRGVAPALVAAGVPAVLAMQDLVPVDTARKFSQTFYKQLLKHGQIDLASNQARSSVMTANLAGAVILVLFMRLRSGTLLDKPGQITSKHGDEEDFWEYLLDRIAERQCIPFLGPRVNAGLLPDREAVARALAGEHDYPLPDDYDLVKVAQFISMAKTPGFMRNGYLRFMKHHLPGYLDVHLTDAQKRQFRQASFSQMVEELEWTEKVLAVQENEPHHLLADLDLPLYTTTNIDNFMVEALKYKSDRSPQRAGLRWNSEEEAAEKEKYIIPTPTETEPLVFHLNGYDGDSIQAKHLVLSEDDYLAHFVRLSRDQHTVLPMNMARLLSESSFLFLGYSLDDWDFRIILQGLLKNTAKTGDDLHVGVQLDPQENVDQVKAHEYFERYLERFKIDIYWGTTEQFIIDLHNRWQAGWDDW
jgi:hypothetical protein